MLAVRRRGTAEYAAAVAALAGRGATDLARVEPEVRAIVASVRERGDAAVRELTHRFEGRVLERLVVDDAAWHELARAAPREARDLLAGAAARIRRYHAHQAESSFQYEEDGVLLGQRVRPLQSVAVYAPGGKARYPSTVLMTAIPAAVAGVPRIVLVTPRPTAEVLAAAELAGVTEVIDSGGAQAIAAVAYGTETVRRVDKIVGPGNLYVACAKRVVFGDVAIDQIAGPSEILIVADGHADPAVVAADLLSQAEHDEDAYPLLVVLTDAQAHAVCAELERQVASLPRRVTAEAACRARGVVFVAGELAEAARLADVLAPEHLVLAVRDAEQLFATIGAAGAAFLGYATPEAAGDYAAGPSHVLPTGGTARFASPLGVYDFVVRTSIVRYSGPALDAQAELLVGLARLEGLEAHARAVLARRRHVPS